MVYPVSFPRYMGKRSPACHFYPYKKFTDLLNVVCILKTNLTTKQQSHVLLFSSDVALDAEKMIDYYSLRFQIEFNFRDTKQYWGLQDFMNVNKIPVNNAVNLSMFMVSVSAKLTDTGRCDNQVFCFRP